MPLKTKLAIYGALGYFILPIDAIPDFLPLGFSDDAAALVPAFMLASAYITPEIEEMAKKKADKWFGEEE